MLDHKIAEVCDTKLVPVNQRLAEQSEASLRLTGQLKKANEEQRKREQNQEDKFVDKLDKFKKETRSREAELQKSLEHDILAKVEQRQLISIDKDGKLWPGE